MIVVAAANSSYIEVCYIVALVIAVVVVVVAVNLIVARLSA